MELTAPTMATVVISMLLVIAAVIVRAANVESPMLPTRGFLLLLIGYLVLLGGNLFAVNQKSTDQVTQEPGEQVQTDTPSEPHMGEPPSPNQPQPVYPEGKPEGL